MLRTFIRFEEVSYCGERECPEDTTCFNSYPNYESSLPAMEGDVIKFIVDKSEANFWDSQHLKIGIADECGTFIEDVGTIVQGGSQYFITATVPALLGPHRFVIYESLNIELLSIIPETSPGACDATVTFEIPNAPAQSFEWSLDGVTYQDSSTFTGVCEELLTVYVRIEGETCTSGEVDIDLSPVVCGDYEGFTLQQVIDSGVYLAQVLDCTLDDFII